VAAETFCAAGSSQADKLVAARLLVANDKEAKPRVANHRNGGPSEWSYIATIILQRCGHCGPTGEGNTWQPQRPSW